MLSGLFGDFLVGIAAAIDIPIFDGGRRAEVAAAEAVAEARAAEYRATFLNALGQVENALVSIEAYRQRNAALTEAIDQSETALAVERAVPRGPASLFDVLDAQRQLTASRQALIDSEAALASSFTPFGYRIAVNARITRAAAAASTCRVLKNTGMEPPSGEKFLRTNGLAAR